MDPFALIVVSLVILVILHLWSDRQACNLPGPWGLPLLGYFPFLSHKPYKLLSKFADKYGDIYQLKIGVRRVVILNSHEAMKEILNKWEFAERPDFASFHAIQGLLKSGVTFFGLTQKWLYLRKTATRSLGIFVNSTNNTLEERTREAVEYLTEEFEKWPRDGAYPRETVFYAVSSIVGSLCFGKIEPKHPLWKKALSNSEVFSKIFGIGAIADYLPFMLPILAPKIKGFIRSLEASTQFHRENMENHVFNKEILDIQDALEEASKKTEEFEAIEVTKLEIQRLSFDLFNAAVFTTFEHFLNSMRICAVFPEIQAQLRAECVQMCAHAGSQHVTMEQRDDMPYAKAFMEELFRFSSHVPFGIAHSTAKDMNYKGHRIPKGTVVMPNLWYLHHNKEIFPDPEKFDPSRFTDEFSNYDGAKAIYVEAFSLGKRKCVGEALARKELFLLITNIVKRFEIGVKWFEGEGKFDHSPGFVRMMKPAGLTFKKL